MSLDATPLQVTIIQGDWAPVAVECPTHEFAAPEGSRPVVVPHQAEAAS